MKKYILILIIPAALLLTACARKTAFLKEA